jgi:predicted MPP superfamily phosphohydrolase
MPDRTLNVLLISDLHYVGTAKHICPIPERRSELGPALVREAFGRLGQEGVEVGLTIVLGDVVDNGLAEGAGQDLAAVADEARGLGAPLLAVPGNHDGDYERFARIWDCDPGLHKVNGYGFLVYHDRVEEGDVTIRPPEGMRLLGKVAARHPGLPLVALQHNPLHPDIESRYPYMLVNRQAILAEYQALGVLLSLSGHYHPGQAAHGVGDVVCYTVPAACEAPFRFAHLRLQGREVEVREVAMQGWGVGD